MSITTVVDLTGDVSAPPEAVRDGVTPLIGLTREGLKLALADAGVPGRQLRMRTGQLWRWIYNRGVTSFEDMTDVAKDLRHSFSEQFSLERPEIVSEQISNDGTRKWLLRLAPDELGRRQDVETVFIPEEDRGTLCISSQVGCTLTCTFCHTGTQRLVRNLTSGRNCQPDHAGA